MKTQLKQRNARGQGMTEYIIITALIAIAAIGVVTLFGDNIRQIFGASADALSGQTNVTPGTRQAKDQVKGHKTLQDFSNNNEQTKKMMRQFGH